MDTMDTNTDTDSDSDDVPCTTPNTTYTIYVPTFLADVLLSQMLITDLNAELLKKNWLTPELVREIESCFPTKEEISNSTEGDNIRDLDAFKAKAAKLLPKGRIFVSFKQLDQVSKMFLDAWAVNKVHVTKRICCSYSATSNKKSRLHPDRAKRRKVETSAKTLYQCPFQIRYSFMNYSKKTPTKKPNIFYRVKITRVNYEHTCQLSTVFHRESKQKNGTLQPDLNGLSDIIGLLREKHILKPDLLRPLLLKYIPYYKTIDAKFIRNFRQRALHWIIHQSGRDFLMEDACHLSSNAVIAADEYVVWEDPESTRALTSLLQKVMQEDGTTWEAIRYLDKIKIPNPGLDYRIKFDENNRPEAVCYILPEMRHDLLRFGDALFLDSQKRQFNTMNWPYIGPCMKDQNMKVRTVTKSICVEESTRMYAWVVQMMHKMEPRLHLSQIRLIFGDQGITQSLLQTLQIKNTCLLRGDYHHLINEVFPDVFGIHKFTIINGHLQTMLLGSQ